MNLPRLVKPRSVRERALVLCVLLGLFGAHRFYLKEPVKGVSYLAFSWTLVPFVLSVIDAAFLFRMSEEDFQEEYAGLAA